MDMITQLRAVRNRYDEINNQLQDPTVINNNELYRSLMKDYKNLTPIVEAYDAYDAAKAPLTKQRKCWTKVGWTLNSKSSRRLNMKKTRKKWRFWRNGLRSCCCPRMK